MPQSGRLTSITTVTGGATTTADPNKTMTTGPDNEIYERAKPLIKANPAIGKNALSAALGIHAPMARRLKERYRGEIDGHSVDPLYQTFLKVKLANPTWGSKRISRAMLITVDIAQLFLARHAGATSSTRTSSPVVPPEQNKEESKAPAGGAELEVSGNDSSQAVSYRGARIRTIEDLLAFSSTDTRIWEVERHIINKWEVGATDPAGGVLTEPLYQLKVWLRRRFAGQRLEQLLDGLLEKFKLAAPVQAPLPRPSGARGMLEISLADLHLGKYAWASETGHAYSPEICERMLWAALEDLLGKAAGCEPEKILFVVGNDFFNVDNLARTTTAGTPQDEAMRWQESFVRGRTLMISAIERMRQVAPVQVLVVPGNHDTQRLWYLGDVLAAWFRSTPDVTVDHACHPRKYFVYGKNLIGYCHGHAEKHERLPILMALERPAEWAATRFREWHIGHFHAKKTKVFVAHQDLHSVQVRIMPSLCPPDAWHAAMGYTSKPAAEALFWDHQNGCVATFTHSPQ